MKPEVFAGEFSFGVLLAGMAAHGWPGTAATRDVPASSFKEQAMKITLTSPAFAEGKPIPVQFTCQGSDYSPPLKWSSPPAGTQSLALICDDPDAPVGTWVHWVLYHVPPTVSELAERLPATETLPDGSKQGINDFGRIGYGGPCPPPGRAHRYYFKLYALKSDPSLPPLASKADLLRAMAGQIMAEGQLMGTYQRR
jgi:Raf kinase inhibitor-like YbhB/YbcL family protein